MSEGTSGADQPRAEDVPAEGPRTDPAVTSPVPGPDADAVAATSSTPGSMPAGHAGSPSGGRLRAPTPRVALAILTAIVVGVVLYLGRSAHTPFLIGLVLIYVLGPAIDRLARVRVAGRRVPRGLSVLIVYVVAIVVIVQGIALLIGPLVQQILEYVRDLPRFTQALDDATRRFTEFYREMQLPPGIREAIDRAIAQFGQGASNFDFGSLLPIARSIAGGFGIVFGFLIVPVWMFYILKDRPRLVEDFDRAIPPAWRRDVWAVLNIIERVFGRWLRGQLLLGLIVGLATFGGLVVLGFVIDQRFLSFAILLAVIAGIFELLPIIGPILSMIPTLLVAVTVRDPAAGVIGVLVLYLIVQQLENNVLVPKVQGDAIELHPSVVIFALIVGGAIAGLLGAIFALPITAAGRDVYRYLFRRASEDDPDIPPPEAPDMRRKIAPGPQTSQRTLLDERAIRATEGG